MHSAPFTRSEDFANEILSSTLESRSNSQGAGSAKQAAPGAAAPLPRNEQRGGSASSGRDAIRRSVDMANAGSGGLTTGPHMNMQSATPGEENARFRRHMKVSPSYTGPIYVAEDTMKACAACGGPLDPIRRVPVGRLFFHRTCVECYLCGLKSVTEPYFQVGDRAVCSSCAEKGDARCVPREEANQRHVVLGSIRGNSYEYFRHYDQQHRLSTTLNKPMVPGVSAPSLSVGMLHNNRNTTRRTFELLQRQQHYTQNDCNIMFKPLEEIPPDPPRIKAKQTGPVKRIK